MYRNPTAEVSEVANVVESMAVVDAGVLDSTGQF
jgi:hypothetical protein